MTALSDLSVAMDLVARHTGAVVNFHDLRGLCLQVPTCRLRADQIYHHGHFCSFAKKHGNQPLCSANKQRSLKRARDGKGFHGYCPFGIWDYAQPVQHHHILLGVMYVGSLRGDQDLAVIANHSYEGPDLPIYTQHRQDLCQRFGHYLRDHIILLFESWQAAGHELGKKRSRTFYREAVLHFIQQHFDQDVRLSDLANQIHLHPNYLGQLIKNEWGQSFSQLMMAYRLRRAQILLRSTKKSITEIAFSVGFNDSNYFSTVFKKHYALGPRQYRYQNHD